MLPGLCNKFILFDSSRGTPCSCVKINVHTENESNRWTFILKLYAAVAIVAVKLHDEHLLSKSQCKLKAEFAISLFQHHHDNSQINIDSIH